MSRVLIFFILLINLFSGFLSNEHNRRSEECERKVFRECSHETSFTEEEIENARIYIQAKFGKTFPERRPCSRLHVRKDVKCLTKNEMHDFIAVMKQLYANGVIDRMTEIHDSHWPATHKFEEDISWHRWLMNEMEKEMLKINPSVTLPYWDFSSDFSAPEKSIIWDFFGHAGNESQDYCVSDGPFAYQQLNYPKPHCLRREWNKKGTIPAWEPPEWMTAINQMGLNPSFLRAAVNRIYKYADTISATKSLVKASSTIIRKRQPWVQFDVLSRFTSHFKTHIAIGGYHGDISVSIAPNDLLFYLYHQWEGDYALLKWQLSDDNNLVPRSYSFGLRLDWDTKHIYTTDIENDFLTYYKNTSIKETFQVGFGDLCYIHDQFIKPINEIMRKEERSQGLPEAVHRLKSALPDRLFKRYFPKFVLKPNKVTFFDYILRDVGNCNPVEPNCRDMPVAQKFTSTPAGLRQWQRFIYEANYNVTPLVTEAENIYYEFMSYLKKYNYCSPYA